MSALVGLCVKITWKVLNAEKTISIQKSLNNKELNGVQQ